jgi:hypothetical protein
VWHKKKKKKMRRRRSITTIRIQAGVCVSVAAVASTLVSNRQTQQTKHLQDVAAKQQSTVP